MKSNCHLLFYQRIKMGKRLKKSVHVNIANYNKLKKSCIVVKSKLCSFICGIIIALSFKSNLKCGYVKKNVNFNLKNWERKCQPRSLFKILTDKFVTDAINYLTFVPTKIKHWRSFLNYLGFNLVIFCAKSHYKILNEKSVTKQSFYRDIFLVRSECVGTGGKYHYDVIKKPDGYFGRFICKLCFKQAKSFEAHLCKYKCYMCKSKVRHDRKLTLRTTYCKKCNRYFYNKSCKNIHIRNNICNRKKVCLKM